MKDHQRESKGRVLQVERVCGEPYKVEGHTLIPLVRIVSAGRARATVGTSGLGGWSWGLAWARPLAIVEQTAQGEHSIPIRDATGLAVARMALAAVACCVVLTAVRRLARCSRTG